MHTGVVLGLFASVNITIDILIFLESNHYNLNITNLVYQLYIGAIKWITPIIFLLFPWSVIPVDKSRGILEFLIGMKLVVS